MLVAAGRSARRCSKSAHQPSKDSPPFGRGGFCLCFLNEWCIINNMELLKPAELLLDRSKALAGFIGSRLLGGGWAALADRYGRQTGGYDIHPASIQYFNTDPDDDPEPTFPNGLRLRDPAELGWERVEPLEEAA